MAVLSQAELREAVKEWCDKRGIPVEKLDSIVFVAANHATQVDTDKYNFTARVSNITMPPYHGPYR